MYETSAMKELHEIRVKIYEETKNMTPKELIEYFRRRSEKVEKELEELKRKTKKEVVQ